MRTPRGPAVVALGVVVAAAIVGWLALGRGDGEPVAEPTTGATEPTGSTPDPSAPTPAAEPTTPEPESPPPPEPFDVRLASTDGLHVVTTDNAAIVSRPSLETDEEVAARAAEIARSALEDFLDAQFTDPQTWFSAGPVEALLTSGGVAALTEEDRAALGQLDLDVDHVVTGEAQATPMVTMHGDSPRNVTLAFDAALTVVTTAEEELPLRLEGALLFLPTEDGWLVEAVEATMTSEEVP